MHLRFQHDYRFLDVGKRLSPDSKAVDFNHDNENVFEWMYVTLNEFDATLNISRDHGWSQIPDEVEAQYEVDDPRLLAMIQLGPTYATSRDNDQRSDIQWQDIAQYIADRLKVSVDLLPGALDVDAVDADPIETYNPKNVG